MLSPEERKNQVIASVPFPSVLGSSGSTHHPCPSCGKHNFSLFGNDKKLVKCFTSTCHFNQVRTVLGFYAWKHNVNEWEATVALENEYDLDIGKNDYKMPETSRILEKCLAVYQKYLWALEGKAALDYLISRGFPEQTIREHGLGYAPDAHCLGVGGISWEELEAVQLSTGGKEYYQKRIILPLRDARGHLVHFQGRYVPPLPSFMDPATTPKYKDTRALAGKSSKDFLAFEERLSLYTKPIAVEKFSSTLLVCEGYPDALSLVQLGLPAVGILGLEKLSVHSSKMKKFHNLIFIFDNDVHAQLDESGNPVPKSWSRVFPQLVGLQKQLPGSNIYVFNVPTSFKAKSGSHFLTAKDVNEWVNRAELSGAQAFSNITQGKVELFPSLLKCWGSDFSKHQCLLEMIEATKNQQWLALLKDSVPATMNPVDYALAITKNHNTWRRHETHLQSC